MVQAPPLSRCRYDVCSADHAARSKCKSWINRRCHTLAFSSSYPSHLVLGAGGCLSIFSWPTLTKSVLLCQDTFECKENGLWLRKHMKKFRRMDWLLVSQCIGRSTKCGGGTRDSVGPFHTSGRPMRVRKTELKIEWPSEERNRTPGCSFIHPDRLAECGAAIRVASR